MSDLFSNIQEPEKPKKGYTCEPIDRVKSKILLEKIYNGEIEVKTLTNSAINRLIETGKEVTQTENGIVIKY